MTTLSWKKISNYKHSSLSAPSISNENIKLIVDSLTGLHSNGKLQALLANIRLGWTQMEVANTLASYDMQHLLSQKAL